MLLPPDEELWKNSCLTWTSASFLTLTHAVGAWLTLDPDAGVSAWVWLSQRCAPGSEAAGVSSSGFDDFGDCPKYTGFQGGVPGVLPTQHHQERFLMRLSTTFVYADGLGVWV